MLGVLVNAASIIAGSTLGLIFKKGIPEKISSSVMKALGIATFFIGIKSAMVEVNSLVVVISLAFGTIIGETIDIDKYVNEVGKLLKRKFAKKNKDDKFVEAFVTTSVLYCVGAMVILGGIDAGIKHDYSIYFLKSMLDGFSAVIYSATLGIGVMFSAISVFIIQGLVVFLSQFLVFLSENEHMMGAITCVGNLMVMVIGLNLMEITKIKIANLLPAIIIAPIIAFFI